MKRGMSSPFDREGIRRFLMRIILFAALLAHIDGLAPTRFPACFLSADALPRDHRAFAVSRQICWVGRARATLNRFTYRSGRPFDLPFILRRPRGFLRMHPKQPYMPITTGFRLD